MAIKIEKPNKTIDESFSDDLIDNATKELSSLEDTSDSDKSIVSVARPADKAAFDSHKRSLTIERDRLKKAYKDPATKALNDAHDLQMKEIHDIIKKGGNIIPLSGRHSSTSKAIQEAERFGYSAKGTKKKWKIEAYTGTEKGYRKQLHLYTLDESAEKEDIDESCSKKSIKVKNHHPSSRVLNKGRIKESILAKETNEFELENFTDLKSFCWSGAKSRLAWAEELGKEDEFFDYIEDIVNASELLDEDGFIEDTTLNDLIWFDCDDILEEWENEQKGIESENESLSSKRKRTHLKVFEGSKHFGDKSNLNESFEVVVGIDCTEDLLDYFSHYEEDTLEDVVYKYLDYLYSNDKLEPLYVEVEKRAKEEAELTSDKLVDLIYDVAEELYNETPEHYEETDEEEPEDEYEEEEYDESYIVTPQKKHIANTDKADLNTYVPEESVKAFWEEIKNKGKEDDLLFVLESSFGDNPTVDNLTELLLNEEFTRDLLDLDEEVEEESHPYNFDDIEFAREPEVIENTPTFYFDVDGNIYEETAETDEEESK